MNYFTILSSNITMLFQLFIMIINIKNIVIYISLIRTVMLRKINISLIVFNYQSHKILVNITIVDNFF